MSPLLRIKPKALFLAAESPYPTIGGGPIRASSVLEYLAGRFSVHAIFFREPGAPHPATAIPAGRVDRVEPARGAGALIRAQCQSCWDAPEVSWKSVPGSSSET